VLVLAVLALLLLAAGTTFLATLPDTGEAELRVARLLQTHHGRAVGLPVPVRIGEAAVAIEDERFVSHHGVDLLGLLRASYVDLTSGARQGGSTITQQLAKALYLPDDHTIGTKLKLLGLALKLEHRYSKARILQMYLNVVYFGDGQWGIMQASRTYFGKDPGTLDWAQASLLAGLLQAPSAYEPFQHFARARRRQRAVLNALVDGGIISPAVADASYAEPLALAP
jgi:penicillin-binding protein 1A